MLSESCSIISNVRRILSEYDRLTDFHEFHEFAFLPLNKVRLLIRMYLEDPS